jgi:hypothetical protein
MQNNIVFSVTGEFVDEDSILLKAEMKGGPEEVGPMLFQGAKSNNNIAAMLVTTALIYLEDLPDPVIKSWVKSIKIHIENYDLLNQKKQKK